jgi:hypothetical protein
LLVERGEIGAGLKLPRTAFAHIPQNTSCRYSIRSDGRMTANGAKRSFVRLTT